MLGLKQIESISSWWETVESPHFRKCFHVMGVRASARLTCTQDQQLNAEQRITTAQYLHSRNVSDVNSRDPLTWQRDAEEDGDVFGVIMRQRWDFLSVPPDQQHCKCKWASRRQQASHDLDTDKCLIHLLGISFYNRQRELQHPTHHRFGLYFRFPADPPTFKIPKLPSLPVRLFLVCYITARLSVTCTQGPWRSQAVNTWSKLLSGFINHTRKNVLKANKNIGPLYKPCCFNTSSNMLVGWRKKCSP